ncbi:hypothetical protein KEM54_000953 [Ascosphaera aggregata]|nr:hypothetical protein KEM54_000953 [Ascosphaera aggregata]
MPRQRGPARPVPQRPSGYTSASTQQRRPTSTVTPTAPHSNPIPNPPPPPPPAAAAVAHPQQQQQHHAPVQQSSGPGLFGQMASTAAGVAVGSSIGHAVGNWFTGASSSDHAAVAAAAAAQPADTGLYASNAWTSENTVGGPCENDIKSFRKCMDDHEGNMSICSWYLDQLKACQAAAKNY